MNYEVDEECKRIKNQIKHFIGLGRYERAKILTSELITTYPNRPEGYFYMALCECNFNRIDNAIELCGKSFERGMNQVSVSRILIICYNLKHDYKNVDLQYNLLAQIDPGRNLTQAEYGISLWKRGRRKEGIMVLEEAFAKDSTNSYIIENLFYIARKNRDEKEVCRLLKMYMNSDATDLNKTFMAGECEAHLGNREKAKICFERVLEIDPLNKKAMKYLRGIKWRVKYIPSKYISVIVWILIAMTCINVPIVTIIILIRAIKKLIAIKKKKTESESLLT